MSWHQLPPSHEATLILLRGSGQERKSKFGIRRDRAKGEFGKIGKSCVFLTSL